MKHWEAHDPLDGLSPVLREVAVWLTEGVSIREIADRRRCAPSTVRGYCVILAARLGAKDAKAHTITAAIWQMRERKRDSETQVPPSTSAA